MKDDDMPGSIFGIEQDEALIAKQAEILALRQITDTLRMVSGEIRDQRDRHDRVLSMVGDIKQDIAVMKEQSKAITDLRAGITALEAKVDALEAVQQQVAGATNLVKWLREFGPWLVSLLVLAWGLFDRSPK